MKIRHKALAAAALLAAATAGGSLALAESPRGAGGPCHHGAGMGAAMGPGGGFGGGFGLPARLAALQVELGITDAQAEAWSAYTASLEEGAAVMQEMRRESREAHRARRAEMREHFETVKEAAETLLPSLDEAQQARAAEILPGLAEPRRHGHRGMGRHYERPEAPRD